MLKALPFATLVAMTGTAQAEAPDVAVDIAPLHSLVARVMEGAGAPGLIVAPGASPHGYSMRPSEAGALQAAELVVWTGPGLTPWLAGTIDTLAPEAARLQVMKAPGTRTMEMREGALFEAHDHDAHEHDDDHADARPDPHAWLDPGNARVWLEAIADELSRIDPENAEVYAANAAAGQEELAALQDEIAAILDPVQGGDFIVFHDAYQYFEEAFDMPAAGAIALSDAAKPGPARIAGIRDRVIEAGVSCVLAEPQFNADLVETVLDGTEARSAVIDPLGTDIALGPRFYPRLLLDLARELAACL